MMEHIRTSYQVSRTKMLCLVYLKRKLSKREKHLWEADFGPLAKAFMLQDPKRSASTFAQIMAENKEILPQDIADSLERFLAEFETHELEDFTLFQILEVALDADFPKDKGRHRRYADMKKQLENFMLDTFGRLPSKRVVYQNFYESSPISAIMVAQKHFDRIMNDDEKIQIMKAARAECRALDGVPAEKKCKQVTCPKCHHKFVIPGHGEAESPESQEKLREQPARDSGQNATHFSGISRKNNDDLSQSDFIKYLDVLPVLTDAEMDAFFGLDGYPPERPPD